MIRVTLPAPLRRLARSAATVELEVPEPVTQCSVLDALERHYPMLRGTTRDHQSKRRRAYVRFFACGEDISDAPPDALLPGPVRTGEQPFLIVGALAGG